MKELIEVYLYFIGRGKVDAYDNSENVIARLFRKKRTLYLTDSLDQQLFTINKKSTGFIVVTGYDYDISGANVNGSGHYYLWYKSRLEMRYGQDSYLIVTNIGRDFSLYKNGRQIGAMHKEQLYINNSAPTYRLLFFSEFENELNLILLNIMLYIHSRNWNERGNSGVTVDLGHLGPEYSPFDPHWYRSE